MEIWITALNLENYEVSNFGRVRSKDKIVLTGSKKISTRVHKGKIIKPCDNGKGYKYFKVSDKGIKSNQYIHIIIALSFIPNTKNKPQVNHKNGIKLDNSIGNLEWSTHKENMLHASSNNLMRGGEKCRWSKLSDLKVLAIRRLYSINPRFNKLRVAKKLNISDGTIHKIIQRKRWKHI